VKQKKTVQISFLPSEFAELPAAVRVFTLYENNWRDEFRGHGIMRLLTPSDEPIATFEGIEDGGCYRAVRTIDHLLKSSQVDGDVLEQEAALSLLRELVSNNYTDSCHLHHNVALYEKNVEGAVLQQFDGILHGHQAKPTYAIVMEAKTNFNDVLTKVARFKSYVLRAQDYSFSSGWRPTRATETSPFTHFSNVHHFIPCLAGRRFPSNLIEECIANGIIPVFPSGARYVAKGLDLLKKVM